MSAGKFAPSRLTLARLSQGASITELAARIGLTAQSVSNIERGRQHPSNSTLENISHVLRFPVEFFRSEAIDEIEERQLSFRARTKTTSRAKNSVRSSARLAVEIRDWIDSGFVTPAIDVPTIDDKMSPELAAEHVRARWGFSPTQSISNCTHLLESRGVAVFSLPSGYEDVDAFSFWWRGQPFVLLSTTKTPERSRFDAAHELGHLVLHQNRDYETDLRLIEREANAFASAFLMPRRSVVEKMPRPITTDRVVRNKRRWKVSALALTYRLNELGLFSEWTYRQTVIELGRQGYKNAEPEGIERETSQLLSKVFSSLRLEGKPLSLVARELNLSDDMLRDLTFGWATQTEAAARAELEYAQETGAARGRARLRVVR